MAGGRLHAYTVTVRSSSIRRRIARVIAGHRFPKQRNWCHHRDQEGMAKVVLDRQTMLHSRQLPFQESAHTRCAFKSCNSSLISSQVPTSGLRRSCLQVGLPLTSVIVGCLPNDSPKGRLTLLVAINTNTVCIRTLPASQYNNIRLIVYLCSLSPS